MRVERRTVLIVFLFIIVVTAIAGVLTLLGLFPKADPQFGRWIMGVLLVEILGAVVGFLKYRPEAMFVNILFPPKIQPQKIDLDQNKCTYEIKDKDGKVKSGNIVPMPGPGGFQCRLSYNVNPSDYVKLNLVEKNGKQWEVPYFCPYVTNKAAVRCV